MVAEESVTENICYRREGQTEGQTELKQYTPLFCEVGVWKYSDWLYALFV